MKHLFLWIGLTSLCALLLQLAALKALPYSSCIVESAFSADDSSALLGFQVGSLSWDVPSYRIDAALEPFRNYFHAHAGGRTGIGAALLIAHSLRKDIPFGEPRREFFQYGYVPAADFSAHLQGEPGHCVTLSGFLAASLLSVGIPARVVQFIPSHNEVGGHNLVEVWDERTGWALIDPSYDGHLTIRGQTCSALQALLDPVNIRWVAKDTAAEVGDAKAFYETKSFPLRDGHLIYPEPWLYLRTGPKGSTWPFRGRFVLVGEPSWRYGPAQTVLRSGIVVCGALAIICLWLTAVRRARKASAPGRHLSEAPDFEGSTSVAGG
jgi:hypothetical protein